MYSIGKHNPIAFSILLFEFAVFAFFFCRGIAHFTVEYSYLKTLINKELNPWDTAWNLFYIFSFIAFFIGVIKDRLDIRAISMILLGTALTMNTVASVYYNPLDTRSYGTIFPLIACAGSVIAIRSFMKKEK